MSAKSSYGAEINEWKPGKRPLSNRAQCFIAVLAAPFAVLLIGAVVRGDFIRLWHWVFAK